MSLPKPGPSASWKVGEATDATTRPSKQAGEDKSNYKASAMGQPIEMDEGSQELIEDTDTPEIGAEFAEDCEAIYSCHGHMA